MHISAVFSIFNARRAALPLLVATLVLGSFSPAHATRPFFVTESAVSLPPGGVRVEMGLSQENWKGTRAYEVRTEVSYSLYANLDLEVEAPYRVLGGFIPATTTSAFADGVGDIWVKAKANFVKERAADPLTVSGLLGIKFPVGDKATGTEEVDVLLLAMASKTYAGVTAHGNLSYTFVGDGPAGMQLDDVPGLSLGLEFGARSNVTAVFEAAWEAGRVPGQGTRSELGGGMVMRLDDNLRVDLTLRKGLGETSYPYGGGPDFAVNLGMTYDIGM
ncbi:MAG: transporter [Nitrospirota bacterium]|nr:transporter [Nitrospirota bacterium]